MAMFISDPHCGNYYIAARAIRGMRKSNGLRWSIMPITLSVADILIDASQVPYAIRRQAYRYLDRPRKASS
jgi:hypothetical protein